MERVPIEHLKSLLDKAKETFPIGTQYRHYKGEPFQVTGFSIDELTNDLRIHYARPEDVVSIGYDKPHVIVEFSRPINEWEEPVDTGRYAGPRFKRIDPVQMISEGPIALTSKGFRPLGEVLD